jgi:CrcB protein
MMVLWISLAGAAGTAARYLISTAVPHGTLAVNLIGSFVGGLLLPLALDQQAKLVLATGFLGGFTTYSAFNTEMVRLAQGGEVKSAAAYLIATVVGCLAAGLAGVAASKAIA